ncbi:MAG: oligosaccharide flippase family protein [Flavobacteriia bacterium]|nr:oligosaccharide flippase family protein [Flavobacteriia bacterium]
MGFIKKDAIRTMSLTYVGLALGYLNKAVLFLWILSSEQVGLINLILSVSLLFAQFANLGVINSILKFFPFFSDNTEKKSRFIRMTFGIVILGIVFFSVLTLVFKESILSFYREKSQEFVAYYLWIIPLGIANVFYLILDYYLRAIHKNVLAVFLNDFLLRLMVTALLIILWFKWINFEEFFVFHCFIYFIPTIIIVIYLIKNNEIQLKKNVYRIPKRLKKIIYSYSLYNFANSIGVLFVFTIDGMMIASCLGLKATGVYTTMIYFSSALQIPYRSLIRISSPLIPKYWKDRNMIEMQTLYQKFSSVSFVIILYLFLLIFANRVELFSLLPKDFQAGEQVFFLLLIGRIIDIYCGLNGTILLSSKKYKLDLYLTILLIGMVVYLNYLFIPIYGIEGAAYSTSLALIIYNIFRLWLVYYYYRLYPFQLNHLYILLLLFSIIFLSGLINNILYYFDTATFIILIVNFILITALFFIPIIFLKLEEEIIKSILNIFLWVKKKF